MTPAKRRRHPQNSAMLVALLAVARKDRLRGAATPRECERRIAPKKARHFSLKITANEISPFRVSELSIKTECTLGPPGLFSSGCSGCTVGNPAKNRKSLSRKRAWFFGPDGGVAGAAPALSPSAMSSRTDPL
jgi:hypothetical protein